LPTTNNPAKTRKTTPDTKIYLTHFPVRSYLEADALSKESTWKMMHYIREIGARGVTADDISKNLNLPASIVYSTLKELRRLDFVFIYPREKRPRNERRKRYVCERATWGKYGIESHFSEALTLSGEIESINDKIKHNLLESFEDVHNDFSSRRELKPFLPHSNESNICPKCNRSHEAMEFFYAILLRSIDGFITESEEFNHFLSERGWSLESAE